MQFSIETQIVSWFLFLGGVVMFLLCKATK